MKQKTMKDQPIPMLNFSDEQLRNMPESMMLRLAIDFYQLLHPEEKSADAVAYELGITTQALSNYLAGKGHVGFLGLKKLATITGCQLVTDWMKAHWAI